ncbi:MAG: hypothetical protein ACQSGP_10410 [Frankia sp.]
MAALTAAAALAGPALAAPAQAATTPQYKVTIIRNLGGIKPFGINKNGDIFGTAVESGARTEEAFVLKAGSTTLQFLGSPGDPGNTKSSADPFGMNNADDVVGLDLVTQDTPVEWPNSVTPTSLAALGGLATAPAKATAINDNNEIVGYSEVHGSKPYVIQNNKVTPLPLLPGGFDAQPFGLNNAGVIVGDGDAAPDGPMAVQWSSSGAITKLPQLPHTLSSQAFAVNSSGVAVGDAILTSDGYAHAVMWANGKITDLNPPGTVAGDRVANGLNNNGVIVGSFNGGHGFVYRDGTATDLNTLIAPTAGLTLFSAIGVNDNGVIVGSAVLNNQNVAYELTPVS